MYRNPFRNQFGFSLIELMVTLAIASIILTGVMQAFLTQNKAYRVQAEIGEMQQTTRAVAAMMKNDLASARFGAPVDVNLAAWINSSNIYGGSALSPAMTTNPTLIDGNSEGWGGTTPDTLTYLWVDSSEMTALSAPITLTDTTFSVVTGGGSMFGAAPIKIFFLGGFICGNVKSVSGDTIGIDLCNNIIGASCPNGGGGGGNGNNNGNGRWKRAGGSSAQVAAQLDQFQWNFAAGAPVGVVRQVTYSVGSGGDCPTGTTCLMRDSGVPGVGAITVAYDVENFQIADRYQVLGTTNPVSGTTSAYEISLTVRAPHVDADYTGFADGYRRITWQDTVVISNPGTYVF